MEPGYSADLFWEELLLDGASPPGGQSVLPIIISIHSWSGSGTWREKRNSFRRVRQHIRRFLLDGDSGGGCVSLDEGQLLAVVTEFQKLTDPVSACLEIVDACSKELLCELSCCIGEITPASNLGTMVDRLLELENRNVSNQPVLRLSLPNQNQSISGDLLEKCSYMLQDEQFDQLLILLEDYFQQKDLQLSAESLYRFNQDFIQMLYSVMREKQVPAHILFQRRESVDIFRNVSNSIGHTLTWIFYAVTDLSNYLEQRRRSENYTQQARRFIMSHLSGSFTRQDIADHVHLSQNHLARLFRQELGMSISDYILQERMKLAFSLLENTSLSVGEVALRTGYENYSYFLTLFRRVAGMTPSQYRDKYTGQPDEGGNNNAE